MMDKIAMLGLKNLAPLTPPAPIGGANKPTGEEFQSVLTDAIKRVEQFRLDAEKSSNNFLSGGEEDRSRSAHLAN